MPGNKPYCVEYLDQVIKNDIPALPKIIRDQVKRAIEERLMVDPIGLGKPLQYSFRGHRRLRVGDYCIIYRVNIIDHVVIIVHIGHRKNVYA
jgi:mRNA interferase RelE/StbE